MSENPLTGPPPGPQDDTQISRILDACRKIAVVGLSPKAERDSHRVARYLLEHGYEVVPVNPGQREILGLTCYRSLEEIPFPVDMADLFLNPTRVPAVVEQAVKKRVPVIWMQLGVVHAEAAARAREAGLQVVVDRCVMAEHKRLKA